MKNNLDKYIENICTGFQIKRGKACCYAHPPIDFTKLIVAIYSLFNKRYPKEHVFIVVDNFHTRLKILECFKNKDMTLANGYSYKILTVDYINGKYQYNYKLIITVGINDGFNTLYTLNTHSKFMLSILTKNNMDNNFNTKLREILPLITSTVSENNIREDNIYSPVEVHECPSYMLDDDIDMYKKYTEYITTSLQIFGDFDTINKARIGDTRINLSGSEVRDTIARNNGWNTTLDMSLDFNKAIDEIYNPNALFERANNAYNIMRQRRKLVSDNKVKFDTIIKICYGNRDKRILIVSKSGEFAAQITNYINSVTTEEGSPTCGDYHDAIESTAMLNDAGDDYIRYKSGVNKGKIKEFGSQALSNYNLALFNNGNINCLSIKSASDIKLKTAVDLVIFTSPLCDDIIDFKKRFKSVEFKTIPTIVYVIYCDNTIENNKLYSNKKSSLYTIIDESKKDAVYDENTNDIIW